MTIGVLGKRVKCSLEMVGNRECMVASLEYTRGKRQSGRRRQVEIVEVDCSSFNVLCLMSGVLKGMSMFSSQSSTL